MKLRRTMGPAEPNSLPRAKLFLSLTPAAVTLLIVVILFLDLSAVQAARNFKHSLKNGQQLGGGQYNNNHGISRSLKNGGLFPSVFNVATKADIYVNATCGEDGPETFCKPSESTRCAVCDPYSPDPGKRHNASYALDSNPSRWWQSPTLARGDHYEYVTITLDLKQVYQISYVIVKAANSPRPAAWILERSIDGENFFPWQYYTPTDEECWTRYSVPPVTGKPTYVSDTEVVCTSSYSRPTPMENGEIHTSLTNGRPGAFNHSTELEEFTQARFVRFRFQGLRPMGETIVDKRRAFYSIKEINVGGHCLCSGHASHCRYSVHHGHQECECERHTCGERCNKCCPMFNQVQWRPGTSGRGFHCEKCNCHGHANSCRYDPEVANQRSSLDIRDKYRGGGVCINCTDHTTGINCEKCEIGYYRPNGISPNASEPCLPCICNNYGSTGFCTPDDSFTRLGKVAGACECKPGYSGYKCDQCAAGYRQFPDCMPCPCDSRGILPSHDCEGDCLCKAYVHGELCDECKSGYFALTRDNEDGCLSCSCSGVTKDCSSARLAFGMLSTREGWLVTDMNISRSVSPEIDTESGSLAIDSSALDFTPYWLAPKLYSGNRLTSYGSNLTFVVTWVVMRGDSSGRPTTEPDLILVGNNGMRIAYGEERYSGQDAVISVPLYERGWYHVKEQIRNLPTRLRRTEFRGDPVTRFQILTILADLKYILIRAQYHSEQIEGSLLEAILPVGELIDSEKYDGGTLVEHCNCPPGYEGLSCEKCAWGYTRLISNDTDHLENSICVKCDCNMHAANCDLIIGECGICEHNTVGPKCDRCASGYYGDPSQGNINDCRKCSCPLSIESNNFSPICQLDQPGNFSGGYVCTQCPKGYTGDHCESCDVGFFGDPTIPGNICEPCSCNGGQCDQETGRCLECRGNTDGWKCERCKDLHYGNPLELDCKPCDCHHQGSSSSHCDSESGQCLCRPLFTGRTCSNCIQGFGNVSAGCVECNCDIGAVKNVCDSVTGECECLQGVIGPRCDQCDHLYYGLSSEGCLGCRCNVIGSISSTCDIVTGQCQCKSQVTGRACNRCETGFWGMSSGGGCRLCECDVIGSLNSSCEEDTGHCHCRQGIGGPRCNSCLPGYYGFSYTGCQLCEPCKKPGHICDPDTGRCVCPILTLGEHCDRCRSGAYGLIPGIGCKSCSCSTGAIRSQCNSDGQCSCRDGFNGLRCDRCDQGYYGYPRCRPCACSNSGTVLCGDKICPCDQTNGQCPCKENAIGRQCNDCKEGTFGLTLKNQKGCTECFCFGRSESCHEARFSWGQRRLPRPRTLYINETVDEIIINNFGRSYILSSVNGGLNVTNSYTVIPDTEGDVTIPLNLYYNYPFYWKLPKSFLGDKIISYGGYIEFSIETDGGELLSSNLLNRYPVILLQGNDHVVLEHYPYSTVENHRYKIRLHESLWQLQNRPDIPISRETLMIALQNLQHILVKASDYSEFTKTTLLEASFDAAVLTPTRSPPFATDVEICNCPLEYNGTSCQDPSIGYYRWYENRTSISTIVIDLIGKSRPCQCNGRSKICNIETGYCLNCSENTTGEHCQLCADSFYGDPDIGGCKSCPCPHADKRFSSTCEIYSDTDVVCHCKPGYTGNKCQRCSYGYYGTPTITGGSCAPCDCNKAGSLNNECNEETGQCNCRHGSTGRDCSQCTKPRHVFIGDVCTSCNDNCTGILLDYLDNISSKLKHETVHISNGYIPPPWENLSHLNDSVWKLHADIELDKNIRERMKNIPWRDYKTLKNYADGVFERAVKLLNQASIHKSRSNDIKNNIYSVQLEIANIQRKLKDTALQLSIYGDENSKIEIENGLKEATIVLNKIKSINLSERMRDIESILNNATEYIDWINSFDDEEDDLNEMKTYSNQYKNKFIDFKRIIESLMENLYTYDQLYENNDIGSKYINNQYIEINNSNKDNVEAIDEGRTLVDEARGFYVDSKNNFQDLPTLNNELSNLSDILTNREGILYRLNYEYEEMYVIPAKQHAQNLSEYVDRYVSLFAETRDEAVNPLKASQAYKNIADALYTAKMNGQEAKSISDEIHDMIFPGDCKLDTLLNLTQKMIEKSSELWNQAEKYEKPAILLKKQLADQKQGIVDLKDTLNGTGIKDNQINVKLRELKSNSVESQIYLQSLLKDNEMMMNSFENTNKDINDYEKLIKNGLKPKLQELKQEGDSKISLASEKLTEAQSTIKRADAKLISLTNAFVKRKNEFDKWNDTLAVKLQYLKDKITEARNTADGIRISLKSVDDKKCVRSYRPATIQPSTTNTIVITFAIEDKHRQGSLFYLPSSISDDFIALEMVNRKIRFLWNVGGGTGVLTHPEVIEAGDDLQIDNIWYRIEAERTRNIGKLSVRKQTSTSGRYLPVMNSTNPEYGSFDIKSSDRLWLGGIPESQNRPIELMASNGLPGCIHQVILDGKPIGLWNFVTSAPDMACEACTEGVEDARDDIAYSFNGEGYAVRNRVASGPYSKYTFGVSITFRTFDENALLFLAINPKNSQHIMIFLREGRIVLRISYGGNTSMEMLSMNKYNNGNWTKIDALRHYHLRKGIEQCSLSIGGSNNDKKIGAPTPQPKKEDIPDLLDSKYYIGGVPPSFKNQMKFILPSPISFLGCMSNIFVQEGYDPMAEQYYGVEPSCGNKHIKIVGFYGTGYLEHNAYTLKKISSYFSFSFRTLQENAMLLLSTFQKLNNGDDYLSESYYSVAIINGQIQFRGNAGKGELILQSNETFNDGKYHSISITKERKVIELRIDDAYQSNGRLPTGAAIRAPEFNGGLYFGGLPDSINETNLVYTNIPLMGAIKDVIFNDEVLRLDEPVSFKGAAIGRAGPSMGKDQAMHSASASLSRDMSTQPEGCQKVPYYSLEPGALKFGDKPHSHTQLYLNFKKFWDKKYVIEFDFRTYYPNGLLFITPGIRLKHYLMMVVRNGQLLLLIKSRQKKEILFKSTFNDGNWHHVVLKHDERRLTMLVDNQAPQSIKIQKKIGLVTMMYIGGLPESGTPIPEQVVTKLETLKGCIRGLSVNGNVHDMVGSTSRAYNVGQCFPSVESGAYFQDDAYAVYKKNFELGAVLELQLEFRTSEYSGVLLSITAEGGSPSISLELYNGKIIMSADLGDNNPLYVEQHFPSPYTVCDNRWHRIQALYNDEQLALKVDELDQKYGLPINGNYHFMRGGGEEVVSSPLYIGGLPENAAKGTLITRDNFNGCIRNVMIGGERRDWTDMTELHNIHLSSCPIQQ